jgi:hypothetical protein
MAMKHWLKENWFKAGILILILIGIASVSYYYVIFLPHRGSQTIPAIQANNTSTAYQNPFTGLSTNQHLASTSASPVVSTPTSQPTEDPTLKIAICQSDAQIESKKDISRYNLATVQDFTACAVKPGCNATGMESLFQTIADNKGQATYQEMYNLCLKIPQATFDSLTRTLDGYWTQCTASNPTPNDADTSGTEGMNIYSARVDCINNLEQTQGL